MTTLSRKTRKKRTGIVASNKADKSITVHIVRKVKHPLYGKYIKKTTKVMAHDVHNGCQVGDTVLIMETRPLSKRKCWRLVKILHKKTS